MDFDIKNQGGGGGKPRVFYGLVLAGMPSEAFTFSGA
jgi:hypothetical protein